MKPVGRAPSRALKGLKWFLIFTGATDLLAALLLFIGLDLVVSVSGIPQPIPLLFPRTIALLLVVYALVQFAAARRIPDGGALLGIAILGRLGYFALTVHAFFAEPAARLFILFGGTDLAYAAVYILLILRSPEMNVRDLLKA
ncbi:MAG: hypothetical protein HYR98_03920 [Nitrospirae bacterium]|nr:hypothetical protein [Nitrospirota bacterium]MBI3393431.1 hypothetical protein [Nitrospirota bacterium]